MTGSLINTPTISLLEQAAIFGERRHEILAGNIANVGTPFYSRRDLPVKQFQQALQKAVAQVRNPTSPKKANAAAPSKSTQPTLDELFPQSLFQAIRTDEAHNTSHDANNRQIEKETMTLTKNSMMQNYLLELLRFQMSSLNAVISERL